MMYAATAVRRAARALTLGVVCVATAACDEGVSPVLYDGTFAATVEAPAGQADGAVLIELKGAGIGAIEGVGARVWSDVDGEVARVLLIADAPGQLRFSVRLSNARTLPTATVLQVSDAADDLRPSVVGYTVRFWQ